jgi:hypothetical protein
LKYSIKCSIFPSAVWEGTVLDESRLVLVCFCCFVGGSIDDSYPLELQWTPVAIVDDLQIAACVDGKGKGTAREATDTQVLLGCYSPEDTGDATNQDLSAADISTPGE